MRDGGNAHTKGGFGFVVRVDDSSCAGDHGNLARPPPPDRASRAGSRTAVRMGNRADFRMAAVASCDGRYPCASVATADDASGCDTRCMCHAGTTILDFYEVYYLLLLLNIQQVVLIEPVHIQKGC